MNRKFAKHNHKKLIIILLLVILACALYMTVGVKFGNRKLVEYSMKIRTPKLIAMIITAYAIGSAAIVFQSIINNTKLTIINSSKVQNLFLDKFLELTIKIKAEITV